MRLSRFARTIAGHETDTDAWPSWVPNGSRRRLDPLVRLATAAVDRIYSQGPALPDYTAVIFATSYGAVESTLKFANSIKTYGDAGGSPTPFTTSVHNSCAAAIGELRSLRGPTTTISHGAASPLIAVRFAMQLVDTQRAPAALVIAGERHNDWSRNVVTTLTGSQWPVSDGLTAMLIEPDVGPGREIKYGHHKADITLHGGALTPRDQQILDEKFSTNQCAPTLLNAWWPGCALAALDWINQQSYNIAEIEDGRLDQCWLGPHHV